MSSPYQTAIKANGDIDKFFTLLNNMMDLTIEQLTDRFAIQCQKKVRNYPFLMGQGVWLDSEGLAQMIPLQKF